MTDEQSPKRRSKSRWLAPLILIAALGAGGWYYARTAGTSGARIATSEKSASKPAKPEQRGGEAPTVEVGQARAGKSANDIRAIGSLQSDETVQIAPEISGRVAEVIFQEGRPVKKDDILIKFDDALAKAELADAEARLTLASANNDRARTLARSGTVSERGRDEAVANFETAQAAVELARTRMSKLILRAPFDGIAGIRNVSVGAFVNAGTAVLNLEKIDHLKVDFKIPELYLSKIAVGQKLEVTVDAIPDKSFVGEIYVINPMIDVNGRALQLRGRLANEGLVLRPGLFARITIKGLDTKDVVLIPESAAQAEAGEVAVFQVDGSKVSRKLVKLGERNNGEVEVLEGLVPGAVVVTAGQQKLRDGATVEVLPSKKTPMPAELNDSRPTRAARSG